MRDATDTVFVAMKEVLNVTLVVFVYFSLCVYWM